MDLKIFRKQWNTDQKRLRNLLKEGSDLQAAKELFFKQHQVLHSAVVYGQDLWSYADDIFSDVTTQGLRQVPDGEEHSLLWILWHISRIEDITMRVLVEGVDQEYLSGGWEEKLASRIHHTGNAGSPEDSLYLTQTLNHKLLLDYRNAVGKNTRKMVNTLEWDQLIEKVPPDRLERLISEGAVLPEAEGLIKYWGRRVNYELLLMPPTRHLLVHLNEARSIKDKFKVDADGL